ncbi:zinc-type alcohol dehydrogenase-like protein-like protein [Pseudoneurospora amorphoporcata]|uniref:Zinc-type alcohol dehydrogenase-like protein-like protein n=1 Tax=Pseudoneurospora amorphoporcata TaxID=241081 RepID=A0AAN6NNX8_9PEZI|nr:zinc-type alcohol dehydrogenase-like protein-like protein [Pseudoneurospora amorphoporcata]
MTASPQSWIIASQKDDLTGLAFKNVANTRELGPHDVRVELRAASLNYRDLMIAKGALGLKSKPNAIPGSDGAGIVTQVGAQVQSLKPGDRVVTHMLPRHFEDASLSEIDDLALPHMGHISAGLGQNLDGTLATHGVFPESCLCKLPGDLSFEEAATLTCSGITAWNALMGLEGKKVRAGDWVLVQGSGGVSVAALQFAVAAGAVVVATTSSEEKGARLRALGASHVINYRQLPEWGAAAKKLTPGGHGFDIVVDVGGDATLGQALQAVRIDGLVVVAGIIGGSSEAVPLMSVLSTLCVVRGVVLGTRQMMADMIAFAAEKGVKPALDTEVFSLAEAKAAFKRLEEQKHFSKVVIRIPGGI